MESRPFMITRQVDGCADWWNFDSIHRINIYDDTITIYPKYEDPHRYVYETNERAQEEYSSISLQLSRR